jgi:hypothetical protein
VNYQEGKEGTAADCFCKVQKYSDERKKGKAGHCTARLDGTCRAVQCPAFEATDQRYIMIVH